MLPHALLLLDDQTRSVGLATAIADYAANYTIDSDSAIQTARHCLIDALGRGLEALRDPLCVALIGPLVPGAVMPGGARLPGTSLELDPAQAAFCATLTLCRPARAPAPGCPPSTAVRLIPSGPSSQSRIIRRARPSWRARRL